MPLMGFFSSLSCLYSWKAWLMPRRGFSRRWATWMETTRLPITSRSRSRPGPTAWILSPFSSSCTVVTSWPPSPCAILPWAMARVPTEPMAGSFTCRTSLLFRSKRVIAGRAPRAGHEASVAKRGALERLVVGLGDLEGLVQGLLDLRLEPPLDRGGDEVGGDEEDQDTA